MLWKWDNDDEKTPTTMAENMTNQSKPSCSCIGSPSLTTAVIITRILPSLRWKE
jgi:hypothetical protein